MKKKSIPCIENIEDKNFLMPYESRDIPCNHSDKDAYARCGITITDTDFVQLYEKTQSFLDHKFPGQGKDNCVVLCTVLCVENFVG